MTIDRDTLIAKIFFHRPSEFALWVRQTLVRGPHVLAYTLRALTRFFLPTSQTLMGSLIFLIGFGSISLHAGADTTIYNFPEVKEYQNSKLDKMFTVKVGKKDKNPDYKNLNMQGVAEMELKNLITKIEAFKKKTPSWTIADELLKKLKEAKNFKRYVSKYSRLLEDALISNLDYDAQDFITVYYVIPRIIIDFRELLSDKLGRLDPKVAMEIEKRFNRYVFKSGHKDGYLKQLMKRHSRNYSRPRMGDKSLLGAAYPPGNTYYSQSYMVEAFFSLLADPYNINSHVLFKFLLQETEFKAPFGIMVRDLKRIFPRSLDSTRKEIQKKLMDLHENIDPAAKNYLVQQWVPVGELDKKSHLEYFGHGFPVYVNKDKDVQYRTSKLPIYWKKYDLLSPETYWKAFVRAKGNSKQYHIHPDLPKREKVDRPIFPLRLYFEPKIWDYKTYAFPGEDMQDYREDLKQLVDQAIEALTKTSVKDLEAKTDAAKGTGDKSKLVSKPTGKKGKPKPTTADSVGNVLGKATGASDVTKLLSSVVGR